MIITCHQSQVCISQGYLPKLRGSKARSENQPHPQKVASSPILSTSSQVAQPRSQAPQSSDSPPCPVEILEMQPRKRALRCLLTWDTSGALTGPCSHLLFSLSLQAELYSPPLHGLEQKEDAGDSNSVFVPQWLWQRCKGNRMTAMVASRCPLRPTLALQTVS